MSHTVSFDLFPGQPILTRCHLTYESDQVLDTQLLERLIRTILMLATVLWLRGDDCALNQEQNLTVIREFFEAENDQVMLHLLRPFNRLLIQNDRYRMDYENNMVIQLE